jgi:hypothetical protein
MGEDIPNTRGQSWTPPSPRSLCYFENATLEMYRTHRHLVWRNQTSNEHFGKQNSCFCKHFDFSNVYVTFFLNHDT